MNPRKPQVFTPHASQDAPSNLTPASAPAAQANPNPQSASPGGISAQAGTGLQPTPTSPAQNSQPVINPGSPTGPTPAAPTQTPARQAAHGGSVPMATSSAQASHPTQPNTVNNHGSVNQPAAPAQPTAVVSAPTQTINQQPTQVPHFSPNNTQNTPQTTAPKPTQSHQMAGQAPPQTNAPSPQTAAYQPTAPTGRSGQKSPQPQKPPQAAASPAYSVPSPQNQKEYGKPKNNRAVREGIRGFFSLALLLIATLVISTLVSRFVFQSYVVDGSSMQPTLDNHDRLIISRAGVTWANLRGEEYIPDRGDIVVVEVPVKDDPLIKRVIALPGERVVVQDGKITVFNDENPKGFDPDKQLGIADELDETYGSIDLTVEEGSIFVVGDNRPRGKSQDSRYPDVIGNIPSENIIGVLTMRIYPLSGAQRF